MYQWLCFSCCILLSVFQHDNNAQVKDLTKEEVILFQELIEKQYPLMKDIYGAIDSLKFHIQKSSNYFIQNIYYNGWCHDTYISNVFLFEPNRTIRNCIINCPRSWHDSTLMGYRSYQFAEKMYKTYSRKVVVDSAFRVSDADYLIGSSQEEPMEGDKVTVNSSATLVWQLSEWDMRMILGQFPRMKDNLPLEEFGERKVILGLLVLLYNYQVSEVCINTILNTYMLDKTLGKFYQHTIAEIETSRKEGARIARGASSKIN